MEREPTRSGARRRLKAKDMTDNASSVCWLAGLLSLSLLFYIQSNDERSEELVWVEKLCTQEKVCPTNLEWLLSFVF
jgi:hypothetical protein